MALIKRAIVSVTDKTGVVDFCKRIAAMGVEILSTGGTAKVLRDAGLKVIDVSDFTGSPEILDGRLKTLHPKIEGGILGIRSNKTHQKEMGENKILPIDLVVVNLYAFDKTIADPQCTLEHAIENIDIGGPTMLRAAAKNHHDVTVIVDSTDYDRVAKEMEASKGQVSPQTNFELAVKVFQITARYDASISNYLSQTLQQTSFPTQLNFTLQKIQDVRYGENPHQKAAVYKDSEGGITSLHQIQGKELSFNNYLDLDAAWNCVKDFTVPACVIIKHTNPCGVAFGQNLNEAFNRAKSGDPVSAFGGIIGFNGIVDEKTAQSIGETFFECILAPAFDEKALAVLLPKKNLRLVTVPGCHSQNKTSLDLKRISGGFLVQEKDTKVISLSGASIPTETKPTSDELTQLDFAWKVVKHVKSNAIVIVKDYQTLGIGAGQMSRVDSVQIAIQKSNKSLSGAFLASDAFFPFRDSIDQAAKVGIKAIVQPGGSVRDNEVIQAANEHGIAMVFTGTRHFKH